VALHFREVKNRLDGLFASGLDKGTGVGDHQIGALGTRGHEVPLGLQQSRQLVGVHLILGTTERLDPVPHRASLSRSNTERTALGV
jgi:hypothetical protein